MSSRGARIAAGVVVVVLIVAVVVYFLLPKALVQVVAYSSDGRALSNNGSLAAGAPVVVKFSQAMDAGSAHLTIGRTTESPQSWSQGDRVASFDSSRVQPGSTVQLSVSGKAQAGGTVAPNSLSVKVVELLPADASPGSAFQPTNPVEITIENAPEARPQSGLQQADIVYEYLSEYGITRMTAIYFGKPPSSNIGPVRSCRLINLFVPFAYQGLGLCSGASRGTEHLLFSKPFVPVLQQPFAPKYFFRTTNNVVPHNLYTNGTLAYRARHQWPHGQATYVVDAGHADNGLGSPAPAPSVDLHHVVYKYDAATQTYLRFDRGQPFIDTSTGHQLRVKNVILVTVGWHLMNYVEDDYGGARSVWYDVTGSGPATIYADGRMVGATWHMCQANVRWSNCHSPIYFTDAQGRVIRLDEGLTWIHVLGRNQDPNS